MNVRSASVSLVLLALVAGCSSSGGDDDDDGGHNNGNANFTATINGTPWAAASYATVAQLSGAGTYSLVGGSADGTGMALTLYNISGPGAYPLGVSGLMFGGTAVLTSGVNSWSTPLSGTAGTVTLSTASATRIVGDFTYDATVISGTPATRAVRSGHFDLPVTVSGNGTTVVPEQNGSKVSGTINTVPWNASTVVMVTSPTSGTLTLGLANDKYNISMIISGFNGANEYAMGTATAAVSRYVAVTSIDGTNHSWGYTNASTSGTFNVTSYNSKRMKGTYNITATPGAGTTGNFTMTGTFDIGFQQFGN